MIVLLIAHRKWLCTPLYNNYWISAKIGHTFNYALVDRALTVVTMFVCLRVCCSAACMVSL